METLRLFLCAFACLALTHSLIGQERVYDLGNYKARYELRPGMRLYGSSDIEGDYATEQKAFQKGYVYSSTSWFMNRNTEERGGTTAINFSIKNDYGPAYELITSSTTNGHLRQNWGSISFISEMMSAFLLTPTLVSVLIISSFNCCTPPGAINSPGEY